jgi:hypothetical protein
MPWHCLQDQEKIHNIAPFCSTLLLLLCLLHFAEVKMAEFSPSVAAAAALLAAAGEVTAANLPAFQAGVAACPFVNSVSMICRPHTLSFPLAPFNPH